MEVIYNYVISPASNILWSYGLVYVIILMGLYFTWKTKFVQFRHFFHMFKLLGESRGKKDHKQSISSFQAFCIGVAARVGGGNLAGVALAIVLGGPGAVFWMWAMALVGAASAFVESTLAQVYKVRDGQSYRGGPAYYMQHALGKRWMGILFAILLILTYGFVFNAIQSNIVSLALKESFGWNVWITGIISAIIIGIVIFGGVKRIAGVTEIVVPLMAVAYVLVVGYVIIVNFTMIPHVFLIIIKSAFGFQQAAGGVIGGSLAMTMTMGVKRGFYSNEAGMGSAPNAAATAEVTHPAKQGFIQSLGVYTDTLLICSATAFVVILAGIYPGGDLQGIQLTQQSLNVLVGNWGGYFISVLVILFALSTIIGNYYYGETNVEFISTKKIWLTIYRLLVMAWILFGSVQKVLMVWGTGDLSMGLMAVVNIIAIVMLGGIAFKVLNDYINQLKEGKDPVFHKENIDLKGYVECWGKDEN
ncbi:MAG TPA: alanine/glycine:cation symporter family protein [Victivallales bacterium]|nr:alanine/glycine:cation symporter family protein [Victivallales bacterium]